MSVLIRNLKERDFLLRNPHFVAVVGKRLYSLLAIIRTGSLPATQREERPIERWKKGSHDGCTMVASGMGAHSTSIILICSFVSSLIKKKIKFSSYIRKFRMEQLQSHIWLTASSYIGKYLLISSYIGKPFIIYDCNCSTLNFLIYEENLIFFFISVALSVFDYEQ